METEYDLLVIGGGINGCGIARDAAGRGLRVCLAEMQDLGAATSSASTKLFHGGLRYLEYFEFRLVREALIEREVLLRAMPHIAWPMRFVLPYHGDMRFDSTTPTSKLLSRMMPWMKGRRPAWLIRLGLFLYDNLGGREILPGTSHVDLRHGIEGRGLDPKFERAFEYSDCWVEDARLVVLNARDAEARGAQIRTRHKVMRAEVQDGVWHVTMRDLDSGSDRVVTAKMVVNAAGPWVGDVLRGALGSNSQSSVRLVRGSHIVTRKLFDHDKSYFLQGTDGRIIFAIPYEGEFTLIGTTDFDHGDADQAPECTDEERDYLIRFINQYLDQPIGAQDVVWRYSGVRPLYDDGAENASAATREYVLEEDQSRGAPVLHVFGGKITTYRKLAEAALEKIGAALDHDVLPWTAGVPLPGGNFPVDGVADLVAELREAYPFLDAAWARRLVRAYGSEAQEVLSGATKVEDLGTCFGATLFAQEVAWLMSHEYAQRADDVVWRRSKLGHRMSAQDIAALEDWMEARPVAIAEAARAAS